MSRHLGFLLGTAVVLLGSGCAGLAELRPVTNLDDRMACDAQYRVDDATPLRLDTGKPVSREVDGSARCAISATGAPAVYAAFRLPFEDQPYRVTVESQISGEALFAPEVLMLDGMGRVLRSFGYDRFSQRGDVVRVTIFMNPENTPERYLIVQSASEAVGGTATHYASGLVLIPALAAGFPLVGVHGTESTDTRTLAYNGVLRVSADSAASNFRARARRKASSYATGVGFCCRM